MLKYSILFLVMSIVELSLAQIKVDLYPQGLINKKNEVDLESNDPECYYFKAEKGSQTKCFLIIPGGGYARVAITHEGYDVARELNRMGYDAYVLKYRLPDAKQQHDKRIAPIQDAQAAISLIRSKNGEKAVVVLGFSAGGHLASTLSTHYNWDYRVNKTSVENLRPDYSVLAYPVISLDSLISHKGTRSNLIGPDFFEDDVVRFSNQNMVNDSTPPTFLMHAIDDVAVPILNSELYYEKLLSHRVPSQLFVFEKGGHGFGLHNKTDERSWLEIMINWLESFPMPQK